MPYTTHAFLNKHLPFTLTGLLLLAVIIGGWKLSRKPAMDANRYVINPNAEVTKKPDQVKTIDMGSAGAKREMVQVRFEWVVEGIKYSDAINVSKEEYENLSQQDLEKLKQERFSNWVRTVNEQSRKAE